VKLPTCKRSGPVLKSGCGAPEQGAAFYSFNARARTMLTPIGRVLAGSGAIATGW
jgi:hypothetical protein